MGETMAYSRFIRWVFVVAGAMFISTAAYAASTVGLQDGFLDKLQGRWDAVGTLNGHPTKEKFKADWVLHYRYLRFRLVSEEENATGFEEFETISDFAYDPATSQYVLLWKDNGGTTSVEGAAAAAARVGNSLAFVFKTPQGVVHRTFAYDPAKNTWAITIDIEKDGGLQPVVHVTLKASKR